MTTDNLCTEVKNLLGMNNNEDLESNSDVTVKSIASEDLEETMDYIMSNHNDQNEEYNENTEDRESLREASHKKVPTEPSQEVLRLN